VFVVVVERFNERGGIKVTKNVEKVIKSLKINSKKVYIFQQGVKKGEDGTSPFGLELE